MPLLSLLSRLAQPLFAAADPETAHGLAVSGLKLMPLPPPAPDDPRLAVKAFGLSFPNPVGLAAGFDKHAEVPDPCLRLGFGFVEVGGVTPKPQAGNPRPRVFRLPADQAVINRYGLNSDGAAMVASRLAARARRPGIVGINIGPNKETADRVADYGLLVEALAPHVSYLSVNVSSPNTPGLRDLQGAGFLGEVLARVADRVAAVAPGKPILVKIAPDLTLEALDAVVATAIAGRVDGMIVANTTIARPESLIDQTTAKEAGGLSGAPLFAPSTRLLAETFARVEGRFPLVGVGGIASGADALAKIEAGASLVQLYSALIFKGLGLVDEIKADLLAGVARAGVASVGELTGRRAAEWRAA